MDNQFYDVENSEYISDKEDYSKYSQAVIWGMDWTAETIANQIQKGNIDLNPSFQRRDAWSDQSKSKLIESLMVGFPVPPIILAEKRKNSFIVIDGKQRLLSIARFYSCEDFTPLKLKGLEILQKLNGKGYQEIEDDPLTNTYATAIDNSVIRTIVIKNWPTEQFLYSIFLRLNTGSKPLSPQELRQALHPGKFLDYLDQRTSTSKALCKVLKNDGPDPRMRDVELALRFYGYSYFMENYSGNLRLFLDDTADQLNKQWESKQYSIDSGFEALEHSIEFTFDVFGQDASFSRWDGTDYSKRFNRALFEVFTFYFSNEFVCAEINKANLKMQFQHLCETDSKFIDSIGNTTQDIHRMKYRFYKIGEIIKNMVPSFNINIEMLFKE